MKKFQNLLINSIDEDIIGTTIERLIKVKKIFENEMLWEKKPLDMYAKQQRLEDWLRGLCSTVSIPFADYAIVEWYESQLGRKAKNDSEYSKWSENYWPQCARTLYRMLYS